MLRIVKANRAFFITWILAVLVVGVLLVLYTKEELMRWVNAHNAPNADVFFENITNLGDGTFSVIVIFILAFRSFRYAAMGAASFILSTAVAQALKHFAFSGSLRPIKYFEHSPWEYRVIEGLDIHSYNSFPSGHSTTAFAIFCLLALIDTHKQRGWVLALIAILTAYSRVYLFQHFVEDVFVGSFIGVLTSLAVFMLLSRRWEESPRLWHDRRLRLRREKKE